MKISLKNKILPLIVSFLMLFLIFPSFIHPINADVFDIGNPWDMMDPISAGITDAAMDATKEALGEVLEEFGLGDDQFGTVGETLNVMENKVNAPEVQLLFSPTSPKVAEKITVTALPKYFQQDKANMYFTWYLKHNNESGVGTDSQGRKTKNGNTDWNNSGDDPDIEDYKIEAMKLIASGGFRKTKANYITNAESDDDEDGFGTLENYIQNGIVTDNICEEIGLGSDKCEEGIDVEEDIDDLCENAKKKPTEACTKAPFGGSNVKKPTDGFRCYVRDHESGLIYEIVEETEGGECENTGVPSLAEFNSATSGVSITPYEDALTELSENFRAMGYQACPWKEPTGGYFDKITLDGKVYDVLEWEAQQGWNPIGLILLSDKQPQECDEGCTKPLPSICTHLFPHVTNKKGENIFTTGDNKFTGEEEKFWGTNPEDPDTSANGLSDEAKVAGVGQDKLSWIYNKGDEVGVAVEGLSSNTTKHADSSYMVMWALPKNTFSVDGGSSNCEIEDKGSYTKTINDRDITIRTAETDIDACLEENFVDPLKGGQPGNLEVDLSSSPANPFNDSSSSSVGKNGSKVTIQSTIINSNNNDTKGIYYEWTVEGRSDDNFMKEDWKDITSGLDIGITEGLNKDSISFSLNLAKDSPGYKDVFFDQTQGYITQGYIRVILNVEENFSSGVTKSGTGQKIIKVTTGNENKINLYRAKYENGSLSIDQSTEFCKPKEDKSSEHNTTICAVASNEIVAAQLNSEETTNLKNFSWSLNGEPIECTSDMSSLCGTTSQTDTTFFPVMGKSGERYNLMVYANDVDPNAKFGTKNEGSKTEITQEFQIIEPMVKLGPEGTTNENCENTTAGFQPQTLGHYIDVKNRGNPIAECSSKVFTGQPGGMTIQANFNPDFIANYVKDIQWTVNGAAMDSDGDTLTIEDAVAGESYNISVSGTYTQEDDIKGVLIDKFNFSQFNLSQSKLSDSISIKIGEADTAAFGKSTNIMASLISNLPIQMLFLFRVMLTIATVIFISGTVFALGRQEG